MRKEPAIILLALLCLQAPAREYHVAVTGRDTSPGTETEPFRTVNFAAQKALPGDTVTVHAGTYREWIDPLYGGDSEYKRILYRAAEGEKVAIKGSDAIKKWKRVKNDIWKAEIPNATFGTFNPFAEKMSGDWITSGKNYHLGDVFINEISMYEADSLQQIFTGEPVITHRDPKGSRLLWFAEVGPETTVIHACFDGLDPNRELVEASVRPTCFYPVREGLNYITIRGFHFSQAATRWAPPTAEQIGMIAAHWCKGWIIEDNEVCNSKCVGISLGKEGSSGHNLISTDKRQGVGTHFTEIVFRVLREGWGKEIIGSHVVRNNVIHDCEQSGICGALGAIFSEIYGNHIYDIWVKRQFGGFEQACIKFHAGIDTYIHGNRLHGAPMAIWMDWMGQGARISCNLLYDNGQHDIYYEVGHGPFLIDNNISLSGGFLEDGSEGGAYVHNFISGSIQNNNPEHRYTPYHLNHSTEVRGIKNITAGDNRFYNNIFVLRDGEKKYGLTAYDEVTRPNFAGGNLFVRDPEITLEEDGDEVYLVLRYAGTGGQCTLIDSDVLGLAGNTGYRYEQSNGFPYILDRDYCGRERHSESIIPGPFSEKTEARIRVW